MFAFVSVKISTQKVSMTSIFSSADKQCHFYIYACRARPFSRAAASRKRSKSNGFGAPPAASCGACKAPPHENRSRSSDPSLSWICMPFIPSAASCGVLRLKINLIGMSQSCDSHAF